MLTDHNGHNWQFKDSYTTHRELTTLRCSANGNRRSLKSAPLRNLECPLQTARSLEDLNDAKRAVYPVCSRATKTEDFYIYALAQLNSQWTWFWVMLRDLIGL